MTTHELSEGFELAEEWSRARTRPYILLDLESDRVSTVRKTGPGRWLQADKSGLRLADEQTVARALAANTQVRREAEPQRRRRSPR